MSNCISVTYIYSACVVVKTPDVTILNDPWFTEGIYDGSWYHFPEVHDPIKTIGNVDFIYVSHVHPDHYDPKFIKEYFAKYGEKEILIADFKPNYLANKMRADGLKFRILHTPLQTKETTLEILPHNTGSLSDIDSALIVKYFDGKKTHSVINANDIIFDQTMIETLKKNVPNPDILLCGYTGAGPYPQTYFDVTDERLVLEAQKKKEAFFERYKNLISKMEAKVNIPFAGKYILGGSLAHLNNYRGVADAVDVLDFDSRAVILDDNGGEIRTDSFKPSKVRTQKYSQEEFEKRILAIKDYPMDFERLMSFGEIQQLPLKRLLNTAAQKASSKSECESDYFFIFHLPNNDLGVINSKKSCENLIYFTKVGVELPTPRSEIYADPRYLFGLLTNIYHWNNAEVGSQFQTRRFPNKLNKQAQSFLNFLTV